MYQISDTHTMANLVSRILAHYNAHYATDGIPAIVISIGDFYARVPPPYNAATRTETFLVRLTQTGDVFKHFPLVYMWDDHDYAGPNSAGAAYLPHAIDFSVPANTWDWTLRDHPKPLDESFAYSLEVAGVPVIVSDQRRAKTGQRGFNPYRSGGLVGNEPFSEKNTIFGAEQRKWLKKQLQIYKTRGLVFLVSSTLPLDNVGNGTVHYPPATSQGVRDSFGLYYKNERNDLFRAAVAAGYGRRRNLVVLSGDDHRNAVWSDVDFAVDPWPADAAGRSIGSGLGAKVKIFVTRTGFLGTRIAKQSYYTFGPANLLDDWDTTDWFRANCTVVWDLRSTDFGESVLGRVTYHSLTKGQTYKDTQGRVGDFSYDNGRLIFHSDADGEGYGREGLDNSQCTYRQHDCDDTDPLVNPGQEEVCGNGMDDNCNGKIDEELCCAPSEYSSYGWLCGGAWTPDDCCSDTCGAFSSAAWDVFCIDDPVAELGEGACDFGNGWYVYNEYYSSALNLICCNGTTVEGSTCP
jgi:hypothetical protein